MSFLRSHTEPVSASFKMDPSLAKAELNSDSGSTSATPCLRKSEKEQLGERNKNMSKTALQTQRAVEK